jgi:murein DD-endopeptidase MepM/ murein hydrolase activator NlpD
MPVVGLGGSTIAVLVATLPNLLGGRSASARAERLAYLSQGVRSTGPTAGGPQPAARVVMKRLPPRQLIPAAPVAHHARSVHRLINQDRASAAATVTAQPVAATRPAAATRHARATRPAIAATARTAPRPAPTVRAAADIATPAPETTSSGYVNPLAHASVTPERIDQGVDYGGTGPLGALGAGTITYVATSGTGWPGAFIEFRLSAGQDAGRYVFYAEGVVPARGLHVGQTVSAGQTIATMTGSSGGIEIGWGAGVGTETYAMQAGQWKSGMDSENVPTAAGKSFSALIASLGGPPGKIEG